MAEIDLFRVPYECPVKVTLSEPKIEVKNPSQCIQNKPYPERGEPIDPVTAIDPICISTRELDDKVSEYAVRIAQEIGVDIDRPELVRAIHADRERYAEAYRAGVRTGKSFMLAIEQYCQQHKHTVIMAEAPDWCVDCPLSAEARRQADCLISDREPNSTSMRIPEYCPIKTVREIWELMPGGDAEDAEEATRDAGENHRADALRYLTMTGGDQ